MRKHVNTIREIQKPAIVGCIDSEMILPHIAVNIEPYLKLNVR